MYNKEEIENLKRLLASHELDNFALGLALVEENEGLQQNQDLLPMLVWRYIDWTELYEDSYYTEEDEEFEYYKRLKELYPQLGDAVQRHDLTKALGPFFDWTGSYWEISWEDEKLDLEPKLADYEPYRATFEKYLLNNRDFVEKYVYLGDNLRRMEQFERAFSFLKPAVESGLCSMPGKIHYINCVTIGLLATGSDYVSEVPNIIRFLEEAVQAYPTYKHQYYTQIAMFYQVYLKNIEQALEYNYMSHEINDEFTTNLNNLAWLQYKYEQKYEEAYQNIKKAIALEKDEPKASYLNTLACLEMDYKNNLEEAERLFKEALKVNPQHHHSILSIGDIYKKRGNYEKALEHYELGLKVEGKHIEDMVENYWKLAELYAHHLNEPAKALAFCQQVLNEEAEHKEALALKEKLTAN
jgi:tetratricopeptide (TPR) repeat protein